MNLHVAFISFAKVHTQRGITRGMTLVVFHVFKQTRIDRVDFRLYTLYIHK